MPGTGRTGPVPEDKALPAHTLRPSTLFRDPPPGTSAKCANWRRTFGLRPGYRSGFFLRPPNERDVQTG
jgi:hypothetical protein